MPGYPFDPELAEAARTLPALDLDDIDSLRKQMAEGAAALPPVTVPGNVRVERLEINNPDSHEPLPLVVIHPNRSGETPPCLVWLHGGGFVLGSAELDLHTTVGIAERTGTTVVSVDYRLAPEHPYPAALIDSSAAVEWVRSHHSELGIDPSRIGIGGTSAGACLAAGTALWARDNAGPDLCFQLLDNPVLDGRTATGSMTRFTDTPMWSAASARTSWHLYRNTARHNLFAQYASPAQSDSFAGLPPTFVSIAEFDPLRDEAWEYARRLLAAGVQTEVHLYPGTFHSSTHVVTEAAISRRALDDLHTALIRAFDRGGEVRPPSTN